MKLCVLLLSVCVCLQGGYFSPVPSTQCEDPAVLNAAELALDKINADKRDGFVFGLSRVYDVSQQPLDEGGVKFSLIIDVLETKCHVISRKKWKECKFKGVGSIPVYGHCETSIYFNKTDKSVELHSYNCTVQQVPARDINAGCPDCPTKVDLDNPTVKEAVQLSLLKYNKDSSLPNYFALVNVTHASMQWVVGPFYFVEYTIQETVCSRDTPNVDLSKCALMDCEFAHKGYCSGEHITVGHISADPKIGVKCEIFEPEAAEIEKESHAAAGEHSPPSEQQQGDDSHKHEHSHLHPHEHHHTPHKSQAVPRLMDPLGTVQVLPPSSPKPRAPPVAEDCPGEFQERLGLRGFDI